MNRIPPPPCLCDPPLPAGSFLLPPAGMWPSVRKPRSQSVYTHVSQLLLPMLLRSEGPCLALPHGKASVRRPRPRAPSRKGGRSEAVCNTWTQ